MRINEDGITTRVNVFSERRKEGNGLFENARVRIIFLEENVAYNI